MKVGRVMLAVGYPDEARTLYIRAQQALRARGDDVHAQLAAINANYAQCLYGHDSANLGLSALMRIALRPLSKENEAEVYLAIGSVRRIGNERGSAVRAFRKALAAAPPGSDQAKAAREMLEGLDDAPLVATSASKATIRLLAPKRATITGRPFFEAEAGAGVARIEFFVDDVPVARIDQPPFRARLDLGRVPRLHTIKAVGYDANGEAVGEAVTTINDRADAVRVAIVAPVAETLAGPTKVEADAHVPEGRALKSLELFWNESRIAAFDAPPFRAAFNVPPRQFGYFRAVATLDDGTSAEDTRLVNAVGMVEKVDVQGVVVPVTAIDRDGKRVEGLQAADFVVTEDGRPVAVTMRDTGDEPVTIGLLIDVSGSMQRALLDVTEMANRFIAQSVSPRTKVFLAVFDSTARLVQPATSDRNALQAKVLDLSPNGETSIFDGIAFGLQQFGDVPGKKALVVITDGLEGGSERDPASCIRLAKESAIPIYALIPPASFGMARRLSNPLENITNETGGLLFLAPRWKEMPAIFDAITAEIRGQYLLTFISPRPAKRGEWRRLTVDVRGREGVRVRTIGGYYGR